MTDISLTDVALALVHQIFKDKTHYDGWYSETPRKYDYFESYALPTSEGGVSYFVRIYNNPISIFAEGTGKTELEAMDNLMANIHTYILQSNI